MEEVEVEEEEEEEEEEEVVVVVVLEDGPELPDGRIGRASLKIPQRSMVGSGVWS